MTQMKKKYSYSISHLLVSTVFLTLLVTFSLTASGQVNANKNLKFKTVKGLVLNKETSKPVIFASVFVKGTNIGTVTNSEGKFLIKVPSNLANSILGISSIGFKTFYVPLSSLMNKKNKLELIPAIIPLNEVVIRHLDPIELLNTAVSKIPVNYDRKAVNMTAFYREFIKKNRNYVSVGEAILKIYKASYTKGLDNDRISIFKGRKSTAVKNMDTLLVKLQGGPLALSSLDLVKNPGDILSPDMFPYYNYQVSGIVFLNGRETYEIHFEQKDTVSLPLYQGTIYLDAKSLAFATVQFEVTPDKLAEATKYFIRKKPAGLKAELLGAHYLVKYRKIGKLWFLNYVRMEDEFRFKWAKKWFANNYTIVSEAAITDINQENVFKPKFNERIKYGDVFSEKVSAFEDPKFWGSSNIIEPETSIQSAIKKITRKLKRWQRHHHN